MFASASPQLVGCCCCRWRDGAFPFRSSLTHVRDCTNWCGNIEWKGNATQHLHSPAGMPGMVALSQLRLVWLKTCGCLPTVTIYDFKYPSRVYPILSLTINRIVRTKASFHENLYGLRSECFELPEPPASRNLNLFWFGSDLISIWFVLVYLKLLVNKPRNLTFPRKLR